MRKIDLSPYKVKTTDKDGVVKEIDYKVVESLASILFVPGQSLPIRESIKRDKLATRIETETEQFISLEESEWEMLNAAFETLKDVRREDLPLISRVIDAERIQFKLVEKEA